MSNFRQFRIPEARTPLHSQSVDVELGDVYLLVEQFPCATCGGFALPGFAEDTAYFVNGKLPHLALIAKGVRFPPGNWLRIADGLLPPWEAEALVQDFFPALENRQVPFVALLTEFDVRQFEQELKGDEGLVA